MICGMSSNKPSLIYPSYQIGTRLTGRRRWVIYVQPLLWPLTFTSITPYISLQLHFFMEFVGFQSHSQTTSKTGCVIWQVKLSRTMIYRSQLSKWSTKLSNSTLISGSWVNRLLAKVFFWRYVDKFVFILFVRLFKRCSTIFNYLWFTFLIFAGMYWMSALIEIHLVGLFCLALRHHFLKHSFQCSICHHIFR